MGTTGRVLITVCGVIWMAFLFWGGLPFADLAFYLLASATVVTLSSAISDIIRERRKPELSRSITDSTPTP